MSRLVGRVVAALLALALATAVVAVTGWVVATPQGTYWLFRTLGAMSNGVFSVGNVSGRLGDHLLLGRVRLVSGQQRLEVARLELRWKPELLLAGTIAIQELSLEQLHIQDDAPPDTEPLDLTWPRIPSWGRLLDLVILRLRVKDFSYGWLREPPLRLTSADCSVSWRDDRLSLDGLTLVSPEARLGGALSAGFGQPWLRAELAATLAQPVGEMNRFTLRVAPAHAGGGEQLAGEVRLAGGVARGRRVELAGAVGMTRTGFNLRRVRLTGQGRRGALTVDGSLLFGASQPLLSLRVALAGVDLSPELKLGTNISGTVRLAGTLDSYGGDFSLVNRGGGWRAARLAATYGGTRTGLRLTRLSAAILDGTLGGSLDMEWSRGFALRGSLTAGNLNPSRIAPEWRGVVNLALAGTMAWSGSGQPAGRISASLLKSRLHGQPLTGELRADVNAGDISLDRLLLSGNGFDLRARGRLKRRIDLEARISDLSRLVPGAAGTFRGSGWVALSDGRASGAMDGTGSGLAYAGARAAGAGLNLRVGGGPGSPLHLAASLREVTHGAVRLNSVTVTADGTLSRHDLNATLRSKESEAGLTMTAGYADAGWRGTISRLAGRDAGGPWALSAPSSFAVSSARFFLSPLLLTAAGGEQLQLAVDLAPEPLAGQLLAQWSDLNLGRGNPYLKGARLTGSSNGRLRLGFLPGKRLALEGSVSAVGAVAVGGHAIAFRRGLLTAAGGEQGLRVEMELATATSGSLKGSFSSSAPLGQALPEKGTLLAELEGIDLGLFKAWLPTDTALEGRLSGRVNGVTLVGQRFELNGSCSLSGGSVQRKHSDGELKLVFRTAALSWNWREEALSGDLSLAMEQHGQARLDFQLPLAARLPLTFDPHAQLRATLTGRFQEKGMLAALFPGMVRETSGELDARCDLNGSWSAPRLGGELRLARAGAYLPSAGIQLKDVQVAARLEQEQIRVESFRASSGAGQISGTAHITLEQWRVTGLTGRIQGENFQAIAFPELRVTASPDLSFEGTPRKMVLRGELRIPELRIADASSRTRISPSSDVVMEGRGGASAAESSPLLDARVRLLLGDRVSVKVSGIDASLGGALDLTMNGWDRITSSGEIRVVKGRFRTYGVNLEIVRGRLFFTGGPIDRPTLDVLALRTIGDVKAGVTVAGTLQRPVTRLYSEPAMQDSDILAYVVLGRPLGSSGGETGLMAKAAGALLGSSQASLLFERIGDQLGLSSLEVQDSVGGSSTMGYKPLQGSLGESTATSQASVAETTLSVGKYLTPRLYVSYGRSLFSGNSLFRLRYDVFRNWQIETQAGSESGVDLYYKLEFR